MQGRTHGALLPVHTLNTIHLDMKLNRNGVSALEYVVMLVGIVLMVVVVLSYTTGNGMQALSRLSNNLAVDFPEGTHPEGQLAQRAAVQAEQAASPVANMLMLFGVFVLGCAVTLVFYIRKRQRELRELALASKRKHRHKPKDDEVIRRRMEEKRFSLNRVLGNQWSSIVKAEIRVGDLMTTKLITVREDELTSEIEARLLAEQVHHVLVEDRLGHFRGIISDRDLQRRPGKTAFEVMTCDPLSVRPDTDIKHALTMILIHGFSALPVVEDCKLVGIVTTSDLIATLHCTLVRLMELSYMLKSEDGREIFSKSL